MKRLKIEEVVSEDQLSALAVLENVCFKDEAWSEERLKAFLAAPIRHAALVFNDQGLVAYVIYNSFDGEAEIERIGVSPVHQNAHLGRTALSQLLAEQGIKRCTLEVSTSNIAAYRAYQASGFQTIGRRHAYYHDGSDALIMEWKRTKHE